MGSSVSINIPSRTNSGYIRDIPNPSDKIIKISKANENDVEPSSVDLRTICGQLYDQLGLSSATAVAVTSAYQAATGDADDLSRMFLYYNARCLAGYTKYDAGCSISDCLEVLNKIGICKESFYPYCVSHYAEKPSDRAYDNASNKKIKRYFRINPDITSFKRMLQKGAPVIFGYSVPKSFVDYSDKDIDVLGSHVGLACGYDDVTKQLLVKSSGYFWMPYNFIGKTRIGDCWVIEPITKIDISSVSDYVKKYAQDGENVVIKEQEKEENENEQKENEQKENEQKQETPIAVVVEQKEEIVPIITENIVEQKDEIPIVVEQKEEKQASEEYLEFTQEDADTEPEPADIEEIKAVEAIEAIANSINIDEDAGEEQDHVIDLSQIQ